MHCLHSEPPSNEIPRGQHKVETVGTWNGTGSQVWKARRNGMNKIMD